MVLNRGRRVRPQEGEEEVGVNTRSVQGAYPS